MISREDWELEQEKRKLLQDKLITEHKKNSFINEIKNNLGKKIIQEPNKIQNKMTLAGKIKKLLGWS